MRAVKARQLSVKREKLLEWNRILCSVITAQNNSMTFRMPNCWNSMLTQVPVTGKVGDKGGCRACLSPAPIEKRTCGPPGGGICRKYNDIFTFLLEYAVTINA